MLLRRPALFLFCAALSVVPVACERETFEPPPEVIQRYQAEARDYCAAIVECMEADVKARLADQPERRDMVLDRMNGELCLKGQFQLLGKLSVDPSGEKKPFDPAHYETYGQCARAVTAAENCADRMTAHKQDPACQRLRELQ